VLIARAGCPRVDASTRLTSAAVVHGAQLRELATLTTPATSAHSYGKVVTTLD